jgi:hypothetical protein
LSATGRSALKSPALPAREQMGPPCRAVCTPTRSGDPDPDDAPEMAAAGGPSRDELVTFAVRRLRKGEEASAALDAKFLIELMLGQPEENLVKAFIAELTGASLQSSSQFHRVATALGVGGDQNLKTAINDLQSAFEIRNKITHEMDINFSSKGRNRTSRSRNPMIEQTNRLLTAADLLLAAVDARLAPRPTASAGKSTG